MIVSEERKEELKAVIRQYLVRMPSISSRKLADLMTQTGYSIEQNYALKLIAEIREENAKRINAQVLVEEVAKAEDSIQELITECWRIITQNQRKIKRKVKDTNKDSATFGKWIEIEEYKDISSAEQLRAIGQAGDLMQKLFNIKFDAGVFNRKLGEVGVEDKSKPLFELIKNASPENRKQFINALRAITGKDGGDKPVDNGEQRTGAEGAIQSTSAEPDRTADIPSEAGNGGVEAGGIAQ